MRLIDFGAAVFVGDFDRCFRMGTPRISAPVALQNLAHPYGIAVDVYSAFSVFLFCLFGGLDYGSAMALKEGEFFEKVRVVTGLRVANATLNGLCTSREDRHQSAAETLNEMY